MSCCVVCSCADTYCFIYSRNTCEADMSCALQVSRNCLCNPGSIRIRRAAVFAIVLPLDTHYLSGQYKCLISAAQLVSPVVTVSWRSYSCSILSYKVPREVLFTDPGSSSQSVPHCQSDGGFGIDSRCPLQAARKVCLNR